MALSSHLFRGNPRLEAAAVSDSAHVMRGATGEHVRKVQLALIELEGSSINANGVYGPETAAAVLAYKQRRNIVNRSYQSRADDIVGKMTIAALDREMREAEAAAEEVAIWFAVACALGYDPHMPYCVTDDRPLRRSVSSMQERNKAGRA